MEVATLSKAVQLNKIEYTADQVKLIKSQVAPKATDDELKLFLYQCQRTGLDALSRQIYAIHRWNGQQKKETMTIQTSIDGFRVVAERSGDYGGQDEPEFIEDEKGNLKACKVAVYRFRGDQRYKAAVGVAYWDEYKQTNKEGKVYGLWASMPRVMLSKVAEAIALRKAYPQDLSGLYTTEEMSQADVQAQPATIDTPYEEIKNDPAPAPKKPKIADNAIDGAALRVGKEEGLYEKIVEMYDLTPSQLEKLNNALKTNTNTQ